MSVCVFELQDLNFSMLYYLVAITMSCLLGLCWNLLVNKKDHCGILGAHSSTLVG